MSRVLPVSRFVLVRLAFAIVRPVWHFSSTRAYLLVFRLGLRPLCPPATLYASRSSLSVPSHFRRPLLTFTTVLFAPVQFATLLESRNVLKGQRIHQENVAVLELLDLDLLVSPSVT
ncbi:hypothetical protein BGW80DRAFT_1566050 [Lactifluus volemus]|nr:hypothetical protein BGW80DRAFT_1566050 [Lactifluus volemus]